ncbi:MAG: hypothetical protein ABSC19_19345 [Syntrophorhabdales bacterium]|jgi:hypothetical protein
MARRGQRSFLKRQKEIKRKEEAAEKMARRQGKIEKPVDDGEDEEQAPDRTDNEEGP